jgi:hypothetical protein
MNCVANMEIRPTSDQMPLPSSAYKCHTRHIANYNVSAKGSTHCSRWAIHGQQLCTPPAMDSLSRHVQGWRVVHDGNRHWSSGMMVTLQTQGLLDSTFIHDALAT